MFLIKYTYPGTVNGERVGEVYVQRFDVGRNIFSYTKDPAEATRWSTEEGALLVCMGRAWPGATPVPIEQAKELV